MLTPDLIINQRVKQLSPWLLLRSGWAASAAKGSKQDASPSTQSHCVPRAGNTCPHPIPAPGMSQLSLMREIQLGAATPPRAKGEQGRNMVMTTGQGQDGQSLWLCKPLRQFCPCSPKATTSAPVQPQHTDTIHTTFLLKHRNTAKFRNKLLPSVM